MKRIAPSCLITQIFGLIVLSSISLVGTQLIGQDGLPSLRELVREAEVTFNKAAEKFESNEFFSAEKQADYLRVQLTDAYVLIGEEKKARELCEKLFKPHQVTEVIDSIKHNLFGTIPIVSTDLPVGDATRICANIASTLIWRGDLAEALRVFSKFPSEPTLAVLSQKCKTLHSIADKYLEQKDLLAARAIARKIGECIEQFNENDVEYRVWELIRLCELSLKLDDKASTQELALHTDEYALANRDKLGEKRNNRAFNVRLARIYLELGNRKRAKELVDDAERDAIAKNDVRLGSDPSNLFDIEEVRAQFALSTNNRELAISHYNLAQDWFKKDFEYGYGKPFFIGGDEQVYDVAYMPPSNVEKDRGKWDRLILGYLKAGADEQAINTWNEMPFDYRKFNGLYFAAHYLHTNDRTADARRWIERGLNLDAPDRTAADRIRIFCCAATNFELLGDKLKSKELMAKAIAIPETQQPSLASQVLIVELLARGRLSDGYRLKQNLPSDLARAKLLFTIVNKLVEQQTTKK